MQITFSGKQVDISEKLRKHVEEGVLSSVNKYFPAPINCTVAFSKEGDEFQAEVTVHPAKNIVLKGTGDRCADPYSAFDSANQHIATRLRRHKNKLNDHKGKAGLEEAELLAQQAVFPIVETEDEYDINEDAPLTIAETEANIPVCSVSDAVMRMDLADECAIMFKNISNGHISMVYRRKDGNIGWVEPKAQ